MSEQDMELLMTAQLLELAGIHKERAKVFCFLVSSGFSPTEANYQFANQRSYRLAKKAMLYHEFMEAVSYGYS
jgi:hypothetical protein